VAVPVSSVVASTAVTVEVPPDMFSFTDLPCAGSPSAPKSSTMMLVVEVPLAATVAELARTSLNWGTGGGDGGFPKVTVTS
jgi:hypothetical protein